jgi:hypothetical protein
MIETFFGLARLGHTDAKGMPDPWQLALSAREFSDVVVFRSPQPAVQRAINWRARIVCALARLSRDIPPALAHCAGTSNLAGDTYETRPGFGRSLGRNRCDPTHVV